jgi:hypothetical protein
MSELWDLVASYTVSHGTSKTPFPRVPLWGEWVDRTLDPQGLRNTLPICISL